MYGQGLVMFGGDHGVLTEVQSLTSLVVTWKN